MPAAEPAVTPPQKASTGSRAGARFGEALAIRGEEATGSQPAVRDWLARLGLS